MFSFSLFDEAVKSASRFSSLSKSHSLTGRVSRSETSTLACVSPPPRSSSVLAVCSCLLSWGLMDEWSIGVAGCAVGYAELD